jgi:hypothetical protein
MLLIEQCLIQAGQMNEEVFRSLLSGNNVTLMLAIAR